MLRLFSKRGVRLAPLPVVRRPPLCRMFLTGDDNDLPEGSDYTEPNQQWSRENMNRLLDDRFAGLSKDLGDFKGDVNKSIGVLSVRMEAGFGDLKSEMAKMHAETNTKIGDLKAEIKPIVWQVRVLLAGASLVVAFLVKTYLEEHNNFTGKQPGVMPQVRLEPTQVVSRLEEHEAAGCNASS